MLILLRPSTDRQEDKRQERRAIEQLCSPNEVDPGAGEQDCEECRQNLEHDDQEKEPAIRCASDQAVRVTPVSTSA